MAAGIDFDKYDDIPVESSGNGIPGRLLLKVRTWSYSYSYRTVELVHGSWSMRRVVG